MKQIWITGHGGPDVGVDGVGALHGSDGIDDTLERSAKARDARDLTDDAIQQTESDRRSHANVCAEHDRRLRE